MMIFSTEKVRKIKQVDGDKDFVVVTVWGMIGPEFWLP